MINSILSIIFFFILSISLYASEITFITHQIDGKHFIDENNEIRGIPHTGRRAFNIELVREMMMKMNHPVSFEVYPFRRGLEYILENKKPYALFNIGRRLSREGKMKWVGPLQVDNLYFYENKNNPTNIKDFNSAKLVKSICTINGSFHQKLLEKNGFKNVVINKNYVGCFKMLKANRVDLTILSMNSISEVLKSANIDSSEISNTNVLFSKTEGYMAFSNMISDVEVEKWQKVLDELKDSGRYDILVKQYLYSKDD